jgi:hypothetical protein
MRCFPKSLVAVAAVVAVVGVAFVLITPAFDELPSTGPHAIDKLLLQVSDPVDLAQTFVPVGHVEVEFIAVRFGIDLLSLTCTRLC